LECQTCAASSRTERSRPAGRDLNKCSGRSLRACGAPSTRSREAGQRWLMMRWLRRSPGRWSGPTRSAHRCPGCTGPRSGSRQQTSGGTTHPLISMRPHRRASDGLAAQLPPRWGGPPALVRRADTSAAPAPGQLATTAAKLIPPGPTLRRRARPKLVTTPAHRHHQPKRSSPVQPVLRRPARASA